MTQANVELRESNKEPVKIKPSHQWLHRLS